MFKYNYNCITRCLACEIDPKNPKYNKNKRIWGPVVQILRWIPIALVLLLAGRNYYDYVIQFCLGIVKSPSHQALYLILYHTLFGMFCWSYMKAIFTSHAEVPDSFKIPATQMEELLRQESLETYHEILKQQAEQLPVSNVNSDGSTRYCEECNHIKPDRARHCLICGVCILKMDHHCAWINNCVSFTNYKYLVLTLVYAVLCCLCINLTTLPYCIAFLRGTLPVHISKFTILFLFFTSFLIATGLSISVNYYCCSIFKNRTSQEVHRAPIFKYIGVNKNGFNLGRKRNFQEVFGKKRILWLIPVATSLGDGVTFPRPYVLEEHDDCDYQKLTIQ